MKFRFLQFIVGPVVFFTALALPARAFVIDAISGSWTSNPIGTLSASNPADWYTFYGTAGTVVSLGINSGTFDAKMSLFRTSNGPAVAGNDIVLNSFIASDDDSGPGLLPLTSNFSLPATSFYLVMVFGFDGAAVGSYGNTIFTGNITAGPVSGTPDAGSTAALLALGLGALGFTRRMLGGLLVV